MFYLCVCVCEHISLKCVIINAHVRLGNCGLLLVCSKECIYIIQQSPPSDAYFINLLLPGGSFPD